MSLVLGIVDKENLTFLRIFRRKGSRHHLDAARGKHGEKGAQASQVSQQAGKIEDHAPLPCPCGLVGGLPIIASSRHSQSTDFRDRLRSCTQVLVRHPTGRSYEVWVSVTRNTIMYHCRRPCSITPKNDASTPLMGSPGAAPPGPRRKDTSPWGLFLEPSEDLQ